jgi:hypothetical protein
MAQKERAMRVTDTSSRNGLVIVGLADQRGRHEIALNTLDAAHFIGSLRLSLEEAIGHPAADSMALLGMERVQIVETVGELIFRVYMNHRVSHDYPIPKGTVLANELKIFADRAEAHNSARATHRTPDSPPNRKN